MEGRIKKKSHTGEEVEIPGETYEEGRPEPGEKISWRDKLGNREQRLAYIKSAERYWYGEEGFGSEKRKNPA